MFTLTEVSRNAQRVLCVLVASAIVALSLAAGERSADVATHRGYSVSIVEMQ
jgi:hypothetical protein